MTALTQRLRVSEKVGHPLGGVATKPIRQKGRRFLAAFLLALCLRPGVAFAAPTGAVSTGHYRNLFHEYLGKTDAEVAQKVDGAWQHIVAGDPDSERLLYPVAGHMAYVPDVANNDVRTEGMSYMMMIAVQTNHQAEFDAVWRYARHYMYYDAGPFRGYFAWHTAFDGRRLSPGPADDGEEWFTMALFFASHRWGNRDGIFNYEAEAQGILHTMPRGEGSELHPGATGFPIHRRILSPAGILHPLGQMGGCAGRPRFSERGHAGQPRFFPSSRKPADRHHAGLFAF